jgi:hypothetical protein
MWVWIESTSWDFGLRCWLEIVCYLQMLLHINNKTNDNNAGGQGKLAWPLFIYFVVQDTFRVTGPRIQNKIGKTCPEGKCVNCVLICTVSRNVSLDWNSILGIRIEMFIGNCMLLENDTPYKQQHQRQHSRRARQAGMATFHLLCNKRHVSWCRPMNPKWNWKNMSRWELWKLFFDMYCF